MKAFANLLRRDLAILLPGGARGSAFLPLIFFLLVAVLFPFAVGPEPSLLARTGGGVLAASESGADVADALYDLWRDPARATELARRQTLGGAALVSGPAPPARSLRWCG